VINVVDFGAAGDGRTLATDALQAAIDVAAQHGGGTVYFPAGNYVTGSLFLRSRITLHLDAGATILGSENPSDYPIIHSRWEGVERETHAPLITGDHLHQIAVVGRGTIDGRGERWWKMHKGKSLRYPRPRLISFADCTNVLIEGITATRSPSWTIHPVRCENVTIHQVTIVNPADSPNTDGINPDSCRHVHIANCHVDVGDDCIAIKAGTEAISADKRAPCENITIMNCTMVHGHGGVVIGSETSGGVRNVVIANCVFTQTDRGIRMKSRRGRGGTVEDVRVTNVVMREVLCPFTINLFYGPGAWDDPRVINKAPFPVEEGTPVFRHIHLSHCTARDVQLAAAFLYGLPERPVEDVSFEDISISLASQASTGSPEMAPGLEPVSRAGFLAQHVRGLYLRRVNVTGQVGAPFVFEDVTEIKE
jgi:polygalacturonase